MKKKIITVLVIILVVLVLILFGALGFLWYRSTHVFVEGKAYPKNAQTLDLTDQEISFAHYDELQSLLPYCQITWNVPFQGRLIPNDSEVVPIANLTTDDISVMMQYFPHLKQVEASGCDNYDILETLLQEMPKLNVIYNVSVGSTSFAPDTTEMVLGPNDFLYDSLVQNLPHLPQVTSVRMNKCALPLDQLNTLKELFPDIEFRFTVEILGKEYGDETVELNLSDMAAEKMGEVMPKLAMLPALEKVELTNSEGKSQLTKDEVKLLMDAAPQAIYNYTFDFYGQTVSTATEQIEFKNIRIGDEGEAEIRAALDLLPNCKRFLLENCQLSNEVLAKIRDDYREQTKIVWRVNFARGSTLTDAQVIRSAYDLTDDTSKNLIYCEDVRFIDFGHCEYLDGVEFLAGMPHLKVAILSGSPIKDLTPISGCKELKVLEISDCGLLTDIAPLAGCESLEMLNICYTKVKDLSPLDKLDITHLQARGRYGMLISMEEQERFKELHPDCWAGFATSDQPYGQGWRYGTDDKPLVWYQEIQAAFKYPNPYNNVGWYYEEVEITPTSKSDLEAQEAKAAKAAAAVETAPSEASEETPDADTDDANDSEG